MLGRLCLLRARALPLMARGVVARVALPHRPRYFATLPQDEDEDLLEEQTRFQMFRAATSEKTHKARAELKDRGHKAVARTKTASKQASAAARDKIRSFKGLWKRYGWFAVGCYFGVYGATLSGLYVLLQSGLIHAIDIEKLVHIVHLDKLVDAAVIPPKAGNFTVAWLLTKVVEPVRLGVSIWMTPSVARWFRARGALEDENTQL